MNAVEPVAAIIRNGGYGICIARSYDDYIIRDSRGFQVENWIW